MNESAAPRISRRWFVAGGAAVLLGGGAGVGVEFLRERPPKPLPPPPAPLLAAIDAERRLIADLDATTGGAPAVRAVIAAARADHAAHLAALTRLLTPYRIQHPSPSPVPGTARTLAQLRAAEQQAAAGAARYARTLRGAQAAMLASIAACEATHAELLR